MNPFIYAWTNASFREGFKYFLCCVWWRRQSKSHQLNHQFNDNLNESIQLHHNNNNKNLNNNSIKSSETQYVLRTKFKSNKNTFNSTYSFGTTNNNL